MNRLALAALLVVVSLPAQEAGSIGGVVLDNQGEPLVGQDVMISGPKRSKETTNAKGEFRMDQAPAGRYRVQPWSMAARDLRIVTLGPGEEVAGVTLRIASPPEIRGRVLDDNGEPMPGVWVYLVATEYRYGALRHTYRETGQTDDRGEYRLQRFAAAGNRYVVMAKAEEHSLAAISDAPEDPKARRPAFAPTFFPSSPDLAGAERIVLQGGEVREATDIRVRRSVSYCISGLLQAGGAPAALSFTLTNLQPSSGLSSAGGFYSRSPQGETGPDGRFRLCDLAPGEYRLLARSRPPGEFTHLGAANIAVVDRDLKDLRINAPAVTELPGEFLWAGEAPAEPVSRELTISLRPVYRSYYFGEISSATSPVPGEFLYLPVSTDAFEVATRNLAEGWYVDNIEYGGQSILHQMLVVGSARPDSQLRISIGHDGGRIEAAVSDEDGDPVAGADVYVLPEAAVTEADVSTQMERGQTDQRGVFESIALKPGKYRVLATRRKLDRSPESIRLLWLARPKSEEAEIEPGGSTRVEIELMALETR